MPLITEFFKYAILHHLHICITLHRQFLIEKYVNSTFIKVKTFSSIPFNTKLNYIITYSKQKENLITSANFKQCNATLTRKSLIFIQTLMRTQKRMARK